MEVLGGRVNSVEGKHNPGKQMKGFNIGMGIDEVRVNNDRLEIDYVYAAQYEGELGNLNIKGTLFVRDSEEQLKKIKEEWDNSKKLPAEYAKAFANLVPRVGTVNGILVARVLDLPPPLPPFRVEGSRIRTGAPQPAAKK